jgi:Icc-related predicted phosphoesterase
VPRRTNILITHGPPKYILDLTEDRKMKIESAGDSAMRKAIFKKDLELNYFGHIHSTSKISNSGTMKLATHKTIFSNASCVIDGHFDQGLATAGNLFEIDLNTKKVCQI